MENSRDEISSKSFAGKTVVVTGSTSGIGLGIARRFAKSGADIVLNGFGPAAEIEILRAELAATNDVAVAYSPADMSNAEGVAELIEKAVAEFGQVDILVNNAGIQHVAPLAEFPPAQWDRIVAINLSSVFHATRLSLPHMRRRGWGRIINIASAHGLVGSPFKSAYVAAKHGVIGLTKVTALETAEENITCNAICPGYVFTPLVEAQIEQQSRAHGVARESVIRDILLAQQPNKRFGSVEEIGEVCAFLASPGAAGVTGASLAVDGGWTAH